MMIMMMLLVQSFASVRAQQLCSSFFEFAVDNCTACPTLDHTRGDIVVAVCDERAANTYACVCRQPYDHSVTYSFFYFPHDDGSGTRCTNSWKTAPHAHTAMSVVCGSVLLYPMTHLFYIAMLSGICSCKHHRCTKVNTASLFLAVYLLLSFVHLIIRVTSQGKNVGTVGAEYYARAHNSLRIVTWCEGILGDLNLSLICINVCDTLYSYAGAEMNRRRRYINLSFWILAGTSTLCHMFMVTVLCVSEDLSEITSVYVDQFLKAMRYLTLLYGNIFVMIAHRAMHQVSVHPTPLA